MVEVYCFSKLQRQHPWLEKCGGIRYALNFSTAVTNISFHLKKMCSLMFQCISVKKIKSG